MAVRSARVILAGLVVASLAACTGTSAAPSPASSLAAESAPAGTPTSQPTPTPAPPTPLPIPEPTPQAEVDAFLARCPDAPPPGSGTLVLEITAERRAFNLDQITGPVACVPWTLVFHNLDAAALHNVAIPFPGNADLYLFRQAPFQGSQTVTYQLPALPAADYVFWCEVHLGMRGTLQVAPA